MWTNKIFGMAALLACALSSNLPSAPGLPLPDRAAGALWGLFVGDALAMPVHWYYGGPEQIRHDFGHLLSGYKKSVHPFPDSIMQLSNTGGGGRGGDEGDVVGGVILHDKKQYWRRGGQFHYHHTLDAGENTLEAVLAREMIRSLTSTGGRFSAQDFRQRYIALMTTPGTHNDTYASTCHRMFFQKWRSGIAPEKCPDNDGHNVDTMDGLALPSVVALAALVRGDGLEEAAKQGSEALAVTRASSVLPQYVQIMTAFLSKLLQALPWRLQRPKQRKRRMAVTCQKQSANVETQILLLPATSVALSQPCSTLPTSMVAAVLVMPFWPLPMLVAKMFTETRCLVCFLEHLRVETV